MTILKEFRIDNELGQKEMADKLKCSLPAYRNYENGKRTLPSETLMLFLRLRGEESDVRLSNIIEEIIHTEKRNIGRN